MDEIIKMVTGTISNPIIAGAVTVGLSLFGWSIYRALLNVIFTKENIDNIGNAAKKFLLRIKDPKARRETEIKFALIAADILVDAGFERVLKPDYKAQLHNERLNLLD